MNSGGSTPGELVALIPDPRSRKATEQDDEVMRASRLTVSGVGVRRFLSFRDSRFLQIGLAFAGCDAWVSPQTRVERAQKHLDQANYRAAMTDLKSALQEEPDNVPARILLARLSLQLGDLQSAGKRSSARSRRERPRSR